MKTDYTPKYGIMTIAIMMAVMTLFLGAKGSLYVFFWIYIAYFSIKGNILSIKNWLKVVIWINIIGFLYLMAIFDTPQYYWVMPGIESRMGVVIILGIPLLIKIGVLTRINILLNSEVDENAVVSPVPTNDNEENFSAFIDTKLNSKFDLDNDQEKYWEAALAEYESKSRRKGLWAKLYSQYDGDEVRIKSAYMKVRVEEFQASQKKTTHRYSKKMDAEELLRTSNYTRTEYFNSDCYLLGNGEAAIKTDLNFLIFKDVKSMKASASHYDSSNMFLTTGLIRKIPLDLLVGAEREGSGKNIPVASILEENKNPAIMQDVIIIYCPSCRQKLRVPKNKNLEISCPECKQQWTEKT